MPALESTPDQERLQAFLASDNICEFIADESELELLGDLVEREYQIDESSRSQWLTKYHLAMKLAKLDTEKKSFPWPGASNIIYPMVIQSAIQFNSRAMPFIMADDGVVKGKVIGPDRDNLKKQRADRIASHMTYQLTEQMEEWETGCDTMTMHMAIVGCAFKKTYRSESCQRNFSDFIKAEHVVINYTAESVERAPRITHVIQYYPYEIEELIRAGTFRTFGYEDSVPSDDTNKPQEFYEQHRRYDLDGDGYDEPYIVTVHVPTHTVVRIAACWDPDGMRFDEKGKIVSIKRTEYFTRFIFLPAPDGGIYGMGFGILLAHTNKAANALINQLIDAGTNQNTGGGFIQQGIKLPGQNGQNSLRFSPGEYKMVNATGTDLKNAIVERQTAAPSAVLFELLGFITHYADKLSSSVDLLSGEQTSANMPGVTVDMLIEQGLKVFSGIFKRLHKGLRDEFRKLFRLNRLYLTDEEYYAVNDVEGTIAREDYENKNCDVIPVSNPKEVTNAERRAKATKLMDFFGSGKLNDDELLKEFLQSLDIGDIARFMPKEGVEPPVAPEVQAQQLQAENDRAKLEIEAKKAEIDERKVAIEEKKTPFEIEKLKAEAHRANADAEASNRQPEVDRLMAENEDLSRTLDGLNKEIKEPEAAKV